MKFFLRESKVEKYGREHLLKVSECYLKLEELMEAFYQGNFKRVSELTKEIAITEHEADEIRREMEIEFYEGAFLPFDREDRIMLVESIDKVADVIESTAFTVSLGQVSLPPEFRDDFRRMMETIKGTMEALIDCVELLEKDLGEAMKKAHEIERLEDRADIIEREIIKRLYSAYRENQIGVVKFLDLKEIIRKLANIADRAEDASDRALIMAAKRRG
ncbi:TIGR00153 family protein [Methanothermobacter wolfeii]|uniref:TIGR00153 family protein n=1 Tax=Methanothermobacter wolfeii TaxID=145261 RepID=A0A9E7RUB2_METWO|nr:TIGR00153 family protein [Methanothermobacter wolfeii]MDI6702898.1 TIGR00153 family protein [Methanothermobacter wolfeii]UXH31951.1 TIGR00153 family protein [Methanothermobacter wolfeii]SCM55926.1 TIGR00153 family protein [Methanothermobacter wolfeii]